jgi:aminoglycoside phosphotransferase (APT) family kinase protein
VTTTTAPFDPSSLTHLLPKHLVGTATSIVPIQLGLSGAGVYAVTTDRAEYILRVQSAGADDAAWAQQLMVLRRASDAGIAPLIVHVDERARAVVSARVSGVPLAQAAGDPRQRDAAVAGVIGQLRALHALDPNGVQELDGVAYARREWNAQRQRSGFPSWASDLGPTLDEIAEILAKDSRRVVSHNDVNPGNVLWDGRKAWLIDWEVAALGHPYYDIATLTTFLNLDIEPAMALLALQEQEWLDDGDRATFAALRRLVAIALGSTFFRLASEIEHEGTRSRDAAPTLIDIYAGMRAGTLNLQSARGQVAFGLAFLRLATAAT